MRLPLVALLIAALPATALSQAATTPPSAAAAAEQAKESLLRADVAWSDSAGKLGLRRGFVAGMAEDAVYLHPGSPVLHGREHISEFMDAQTGADRAVELHWTPLRAAVSRDGTGGYTSGVLVATQMNASGERVTRFGRYITYWRGAAGRVWQPVAVMHARGGTGTPAPVPEQWTHAQPRMGARRDSVIARPDRDAAIAQADRDFAAMAGARGAQAAFVAFAAPDVVNIGREIAYGPAEIGAGLEGDTARWAWSPATWGGSDDGDLGFTVGEATIAGVGPAGRDTSYSKYLTIWQRQRDGSYRFITDGGNSRPAVPEPTP